MESRRDERAVTVQIGAVLLLAIVFTALALYQVNVVPVENEAVELEHNQQVHGEMQGLRNAITNAGTGEGSKSVSVTLGTQYPTRTFSMNPSDPAGTLETTGTQTLRIENADVISDHGGSSDPENVIGEHATTTLRYQPDYNEYRGAPTTRIEHGFAYNDFSDAQVSLTDQPLIDGDRITIVLLEGNLSTASTGATAVDTRLLDGPTDPVTIERDGGPITLTIPTQEPDAWKKALENEPAVLSATPISDEAIRIRLEDDEYELQMARVGVGDAIEPDEEQFDITEPSDDSTGELGPSYTVDWVDPSGQAGVEDSSCGPESCLVIDDPIDLTATTPVAGAGVDYAVGDAGIGTVTPSDGTTEADGTHTTSFTTGPDAADGDTVTVYVSSGGDSDTIELEINASALAPEPVVFTGTDDQLRTATDADGAKTFGNDATGVDAIGPVMKDFDNDGPVEIPYVDGNRLYVAEQSGDSEQLVSPQGPDGVNPASEQTLLAVGSWETDQPSIYFADKDQETIYRVDETGAQTEVVTPENGVSAVVGIADVAGDGGADLLYIDGSQVLRVLESSTDSSGTVLAEVGENNGIGVGRPADFTRDGIKRVPIIDGNGHFQLVDGSGTAETISTSGAVTKSPVAPNDWDGDGTLELVFVDRGGSLSYVDDIGGSATIKDAIGDGASETTGTT